MGRNVGNQNNTGGRSSSGGGRRSTPSSTIQYHHYQDEEDDDSKHRHMSKKQRNSDNNHEDTSSSGNNMDQDGYNVLEHIQVMGIANSRQVARKREQARVNSLVINMHSKDVSGIKAMIEEQRFLINMTDIGDESHQVYVQETCMWDYERQYLY